MEKQNLSSNNNEYMLFSNPKEWIEKLLIDIQQAKEYIYIEIFRFAVDEVGQRIANTLCQKAKEGIEIKLVVDSWGTRKTDLFKKMQKIGIGVRFFKKFVFSFFFFSKNHERNHRKIVTIDHKIAYIGSANFSKYSLQWRESVLRIESNIAEVFKKIFLDNYKNYKRPFKSRKYYKTIHFNEFIIIRETPSIRHQQTRKYFISLIKNAKKSLTIITPYFLPGTIIKNRLIRAAKRGVKVQVIIPQRSDVAIVDYMRDISLGNLHKNGIQIQFYQDANIHAKLLLVDDTLFSLGSSNFDYRSFRYMYEINISGTNSTISSLLRNYIVETLKNCNDFNLQKWQTRPYFQRIIAFLLIPIRKLL